MPPRQRQSAAPGRRPEQPIKQPGIGSSMLIALFVAILMFVYIRFIM